MTILACHIATTQQQLDDALRVRWEVFGAELALLGRSAHSVPRENNGFDTLATTAHVVVYADGVPVATTRLLLPNPEVARATGRRLGIDLESKVDRKMGARFIAEPLYDAGFRRFSLPLVAALDDVPASTRELFDKLTVRTPGS